ncbi:carboxylesterase family domain-containing protein [Ditylenchus destructor]|uniref:Carboxylic ester hydrolase n=1 Tax=Ditylenchus destructor TaxID=166010 RepID=A0AAD4NIU6_9BILA|nr:carboxylesterase family domain-containing protein [Ditylenchus destructor]
MTFDGAPLKAFLGVPYAQKPVGTRRFAIPEMVTAWEGEFLANTAARTCYYTIDTMFPQFPGAEMWNPPNELDEDCLTMNIWVPEKHDGTVMVWIFGGGFISGSPSLDLYDGRVLAMRERTIVININYRLGAFGFLYFGAGTAVPGNMGLLDQQMALRWINENIGYFGGDPRRVTLFGESAGGASASAHLFAHGSKNYFRRLIAKSGTIVNNWATKPKEVIRDISLTLTKRLNCTPNIVNEGNALQIANQILDDLSPDSVDRMIACMANIPAFIVQREANAVSESLALPMTFAFVPIDDDEHFFQGSLFDKIRRRDFKKDVTIMLGTVKDEGTYWLPYYLNKYGFGFNHTVSAEDRYNQALISELDYTRAFDAFLPYFGGSNLIRHALMHAYSQLSAEHSHNLKPSESLRDGVARFLGDYFFTCSLVDFADIVADNIFDSVYMYYFTKRSSANPWPKWMGVMHGYEIEYVFGLPLRMPQQYTNPDSERLFSEKIMEFWGRFSRTGVPVDYWPKYNRITLLKTMK